MLMHQGKSLYEVSVQLTAALNVINVINIKKHKPFSSVSLKDGSCCGIYRDNVPLMNISMNNIDE